MQTQVINIRNAPAGWQSDSQYVYIGRANRRYGVQKSQWANPFKIDKSHSRDDVVRRFDYYLRKQQGLINELHTLRGKTLVCYCAPKRCHGHILASIADGRYWQRTNDNLVVYYNHSVAPNVQADGTHWHIQRIGYTERMLQRRHARGASVPSAWLDNNVDSV